MTSEPRIQDPSSEQLPKTQPMSRHRVRLVLLLIFALLGGHAYCVLVNHEFWPLSNYPMYSKRNFDVWTDEDIFGFQHEDSSSEFEISEFVFDRPISVRAAIQVVWKQAAHDESKREQLQEIMYGLGKIYQERKGGNRAKDYREISGVRLYHVTWGIVEKDGVPHAEALRRELIIEVDLDSESGNVNQEGA